jgi:hypothetical protein
MAVAFVLSILPIALVYNMAHYYTLILIRLPALPYLITDPFGYEWNPLSLPHLGDPLIQRMSMVWHVEVGLIRMRGKPRPSGRGRIARTPKACFSVGFSACSIYWRIWAMGAPPQLAAK